MSQDYHITFESPELSSTVLKGLYEQQKTSRFCDLTLYVNSKIIRVHRNVLAGNSPYFDSILKQHKILKEQLTISCLDSDIFDAFILYMYTGKITIHISNVEELLRLANHFIVNKVIEYCTEFLEKSLNIDNCLLIFDLVRKYNLRKISALDNILSTKLNDIINGYEMLNLSAEKLQHFIKHEGINIPIIKSLEIFTRWVLKDRANREKEFPKLLNTIQWISIDHNDITKHIETCFLYTNSDRCFYYILSALIQNNILLPNYKNQYEELHYKYIQNFGESDKMNEDKEVGVKNDPQFDENNKGSILVTENSDNNDLEKKNALKMLIVKARQKSYKQKFIRRLMLYGLKPNLRVASMKTVFCKKKISVVNIRKKIEEVYSDEKTGVKCPVCSATINDSLLLEQHLALSHSRDVTYKCGICAFVCQYHGDYLTHMRHHFPGPPYKCDYCDHTTDQISKLLTHRAHHSDEMVYHCTFCSFKCRAKQSLLAHLRLHTTDKQYKCEDCDKTFRFKRSLEQHAVSHTQEKMMVCDLCGFSTKFVSHMIAHKRMHSGEGDVYRCSFPHCKYTTSKKNQLTSHSKTHNGVRPHSCSVCGRGFMEKSHLVRHERIHLDEKPFKCSQCDYASSRRDKLKEHFTRHHGENASAKVPYKARPLRNGSGNVNGNVRKNQSQEPTSTSTSSNSLNFPSNNNPTPSNSAQAIGNDIQDLIMHHQNHPTSSSSGSIPTLNSHGYHHFGEEFHHAAAAAHHAASHGLPPHMAQRASQQQPPPASHHMLAARAAVSAAGPAAASTTAAAVAAAMMLDPRFHNTPVPYHPNSTPVSMAMAAVQSSQQIQSAGQHGEYPPSLQNCMTLF